MKKHHVVYICIHIPTSRYWLGLILCFIITGLCLYTSQGICESRTTSTVMWTRVLHKNSMCERHLLKKMDNREPCWDSNTHKSTRKRAYIYLYFFKKLVKTTHRKRTTLKRNSQPAALILESIPGTSLLMQLLLWLTHIYFHTQSFTNT